MLEWPTMQLEVFQSFEEYGAALQHADLRLIALGRERARWRMGRCTLDGVKVRLANEWGRFSGEYHALFGELPSQTLQMRARRVCISRSG